MPKKNIKLDPARLAFTNPAKVGPAAMTIMHQLQNYTAEEQAQAVALTMMLVTDKYRVRATELLQSAANLINRDPHRFAPEIKAAAMYVQEQI